MVAAAALLLVGLCCLRAPEPPQWDVELALPAYNGQLRLAGLLDPARFIVAPDSSIFFMASQSLDTMRPGSEIEFLTFAEPSDIKVSDFKLPAFGRGLGGLGIEELTGLPVPDSGVKARVEPFAVAGGSDCPVEDLEWVEAVEGYLRVEVVNRTGLQFDSVLVATPAGTAKLEKLAAGETRSERLAVVGQRVSSPLVFTYAVGSPGSMSESLQLRKTDSLLFRFTLDSMRLARGRLRIPAVQAERRCAVRITCTRPMRIDELILDGGDCRFLATNRFGFPVRLKLDARRLGKSEEFSIEGDRSVSTSADLSGVRMDSKSRTNSLFDFRITVEVSPSDEYVSIEKDDGLLVECRTERLRPQEVAGEFPEPIYVAASLDTIADFRTLGVHGVRIANAELALDLENAVGFPIETEMKLTAVRNDRRAATASRLLSLPPGSPEQPVRQSWTIPLSELLNCGPDLITAEYVTRILGTGRFVANAGVTGGALVSSPLRLALVPDTVILPSRRIAPTLAQQEVLKKHLVSGAAWLTIANRFPFAAQGRLTVIPDSGARRQETQVDSLSFEFGTPSGRLDRRGNCVSPRETTICFELDSIGASLFRTWPLNLTMRLFLPESDTVTVRASDCLGIEALVRLRLRTGE